jgi:hypothetical protein
MWDAKRWSNVLRVAGSVGVVVGSLDPMEGAALIVPGSALLALGSYVGHDDRRRVLYRSWSFVLIALGVGALFGLSAVGGVGGDSGLSWWWALLILPYVVGWAIDIFGPGSSRTLATAGVAIGAWYLAIFGISVQRGGGHSGLIAPAVVGVFGVATIIACALRLRTGTRTE